MTAVVTAEASLQGTAGPLPAGEPLGLEHSRVLTSLAEPGRPWRCRTLGQLSAHDLAWVQVWLLGRCAVCLLGFGSSLGLGLNPGPGACCASVAGLTCHW